MRTFLILCLWLMVSSLAWADVPASRGLLPAGVRENLRFAIDVSDRSLYNSELNEVSRVNALGIDLHKVITSDSGDVGTLLLQGYLTHIDNLPQHPPFFDGPNDWEFVYRIFNFNYKLLPRDRLNLRIGHFEIPFGLEQVINTNGTLRDYLHGPNLGVKADWGVSANGSLALFEYEVGVTRGSGNSWETRGDPYLVAGRIGTYETSNLSLGFSVLSGEVYNESMDDFLVERDRVGVDLRWYFNSLGVFVEHSIGQDEGEDVRSSLLEFNLTAANSAWVAYLQWIDRITDTTQNTEIRSSMLNLGAKWDLGRRWDISAQFKHDLKPNMLQIESNVFAAQVRYRF